MTSDGSGFGSVRDGAAIAERHGRSQSEPYDSAFRATVGRVGRDSRPNPVAACHQGWGGKLDVARHKRRDRPRLGAGGRGAVSETRAGRKLAQRLRFFREINLRDPLKLCF